MTATGDSYSNLIQEYLLPEMEDLEMQNVVSARWGTSSHREDDNCNAHNSFPKSILLHVLVMFLGRLDPLINLPPSPAINHTFLSLLVFA